MMYTQLLEILKMPFPEVNPPDIPILPGPNYKYLNACPPAGNSLKKEPSSIIFNAVHKVCKFFALIAPK